MLIPYVTSLYASLLALLYLVLMANVIRARWRFRVGLGDGGQEVLRRLVRSHGNFSEYVPLALFLLLLLEMTGHNVLWIHTLGALLLVGRVSHAVGLGMSSGPTVWRLVGVLATFVSILVPAILLLRFAVTALLLLN